jgi:hypothetical protein
MPAIKNIFRKLARRCSCSSASYTAYIHEANTSSESLIKGKPRPIPAHEIFAYGSGPYPCPTILPIFF